MKKITSIIILLFVFFQGRAQVLFSENFDSLSGLNGWTQENVIGTSLLSSWSNVSSGTNPTCMPFSGIGGMVKFNSHDVPTGNVYGLTSPPINFTGSNYVVKFKMFRDLMNPTNEDKIEVYYGTNNDIFSATFLGGICRSSQILPTVTSDGWYDYTFNLPQGITGSGYITFLATSDMGNNMFIDKVSVEEMGVIDASLILNTAPYFVLNQPFTTVAQVSNFESGTIFSFDLNWQVDNGIVNTQSFTGLSLTMNTTTGYNLQPQWIPTPGIYTLKVWISNVNGGGLDENLANDQVVITSYVVNEFFQSTMVYELATGSWCQYCPLGHVGIKNMSHDYPNDFIGIAVHHSNGFDPMQDNEYDAGLAPYVNGYPTGTVDRMPYVVSPSLSNLQSSHYGLVNSFTHPLGKVDIISQNWNPITRELTFETATNFALHQVNTNYKMAGVIVENGITNVSVQCNAYSGGSLGDLIDWQGLNWANLPYYVPANQVVYDNVGRALLGGFDGFDESIPSEITYDVSYNYNFSYILPTSFNENNIDLVALLLDGNNGQIVNAKKIALSTTSLGISNFTKKDVNIFPNPSKGIVNLTTDDVARIEIIDITGKIVFSANIINKNTLDLSSLQKGIYMVKMYMDDFVKTEKLILQ